MRSFGSQSQPDRTIHAAVRRDRATVCVSASANIRKARARTICQSRSRGFRAFFARSSHRAAFAEYVRTFDGPMVHFILPQ